LNESYYIEEKKKTIQSIIKSSKNI